MLKHIDLDAFREEVNATIATEGLWAERHMHEDACDDFVLVESYGTFCWAGVKVYRGGWFETVSPARDINWLLMEIVVRYLSDKHRLVPYREGIW